MRAAVTTIVAGDKRLGLRRCDGTLLTDRYQAYESVLDEHAYPARLAAVGVAHARRKFDELAKTKTSPLADAAIARFARIYQIEAGLIGLPDDERRAQRQQHTKPQWQELEAWLQLERRRVLDGTPTAAAIDYTLRHWAAITLHLDDGAVAIDNNRLKQQMKPWAMGRKAWMFVGNELASQRAAIVMSRAQSARLNGHDPLADLRDMLERLPTLLNSQLDDLLPHRWTPATR